MMPRTRPSGRGFARRSGAFLRRSVLAALAGALLTVPSGLAQRTQIKPGWNMFSQQQDVELGKRAALDAARQLPSCNSPRADAYLTQLGLQLTARLPHGRDYPWEFHCVNDKAINAFALPGGFVFVNRGAIEASDTEAQLAGVMAHELSHVALRHGTNQASKAQLAQGAVGVFGELFGGSTTGALLTQLGSFTAGGVLLRYSRTAESQADVMGTQVLYDAGYDPRALAQFFEKLEAETKGKNPPEFFSDHPSPEHRVERVNEEIDRLGGMPAGAKRNSTEFEAVKREMLALPVARKAAVGGASGPPPEPSATFKSFEAAGYTLKFPDNWKYFGDKNGAAFAPENGVIADASGHGALAYGLTVTTEAFTGDATDQDALERANQQVLAGLAKFNPNMKVVRQPARVRLNNQPALSTYVSNDSPAGGAETDWILTVLRPQGVTYFVATAPQPVFSNYDRTFAAILDSVRFTAK